MASRKTELVAAMFLLVCVVQQAEAANVYKYVRGGRTMYDSSIPPEYVRFGYTVLNERGQVIQVVPPAPSEVELAARAAAEAEQLRLAEEARTRQEADNLLLRLYRNADEIAAKRDERLVQLDRERAVAMESLGKAEAEISELEGVIAGYTARNSEVPAETQNLLRVQQNEKARFYTHLTRLQEDHDKVVADAERDISRFLELTGQTAP